MHFHMRLHENCITDCVSTSHQVPHFDLLPLFSIGVPVLESNIRLERFKEFFRNDRISYQPWLLSSIENLPVLEFYRIIA